LDAPEKQLVRPEDPIGTYCPEATTAAHKVRDPERSWVLFVAMYIQDLPESCYSQS